MPRSTRPADDSNLADVRSRVKSQYRDYNGGHQIVSSQQCDDIITGVHETRDLRTKSHNKDLAYLGSVPLLVCQIWAKECGAAIGTAEFKKYARMKLTTGDYSKFKAWM